MIISELSNPVELEPAQFLSKSLHNKGYELLITLYHADNKKFNHLLSQLSQHVADGAFIIPSVEYNAPAYLSLLNSAFPLVFIDRQPLFDNCTTVTTDNKTATLELLKKSIKTGAEHFLIMTESENSVTDVRIKTAVDFITDNNLTFTFVSADSAPPAYCLKKKIAIFSSCGIITGEYVEKFFKETSPPLLVSASFDSGPGNTVLFDHIYVGIQDFESIANKAADLMLEKINGKNQIKTIEIPLKKLLCVK
jgi:DNA-binding LacI/PurR family transcriptional regulator